ncbi:MAG: hypothetical protein FJ387_01430, partial [Verrucomicrobia bacterium]|nr:hypothetical protein [Verrucomicrobiota bacterium]
PTIEGNVDYKVWRTRLLRIDQLLIQSGLENQMLQIDAQAWLAQGLKHRMEAPESFIGSINRLCIQMTHAWDKTDGQQRRKRTLRQMDRLVGTVRSHAQRYRALLDAQWERTEWTRPQAEQVLGRMDQVLKQLPQARRQARQRILEGKPVANEEKILSLYEPDLHVIVRRKAGVRISELFGQ